MKTPEQTKLDMLTTGFDARFLPHATFIGGPDNLVIVNGGELKLLQGVGRGTVRQYLIKLELNGYTVVLTSNSI